MMNERSIRLKLLAGIVDTDGCLTNDGKRITIIQVNKLLSEQICTLARSLGFVVNMRIIKKLNVKVPNCDKLKDYRDQCSINISGEHLSEIPTVISRKKCNDSKPNKDYFKTSIQVSFKEFDTYYGFMVDKDNEFILADFTSVKNCDQMWCTQCHIAFSWKSGMRINGVIHNPHFHEWIRLGGQLAINAPGAVMCGGLPRVWAFSRQLVGLNLRNWTCKADILGICSTENVDIYTVCMKLLREATHFIEVELRNIRESCHNLGNNTKLRIKYAVKEIGEDKLVSELLRKDKLHSKKLAILQVYELINVVFTENLRDIFETAQELNIRTPSSIQRYNDHPYRIMSQRREKISQKIINNINTCRKICWHANKELKKISVIYSQSVKIINNDFELVSIKCTRKELEKLNENSTKIPLD